MAKGLNKAERHAWRLRVRQRGWFSGLDMLKMPAPLWRVARQEMRKRHWVCAVNQDRWFGPRWRYDSDLRCWKEFGA